MEFPEEFDFLKSIFENPNTNEIIMNSYNQIFIDSHGEIQKSNVQGFESSFHFQKFIFWLLKQTHQNIDSEKPTCCLNLKNYRIQIISPFITLSDYVVCIRKHHFETLELGNFCSEESFFHKKILDIISQSQNFIVIGPTGSGKTSFMNSLLKKLKINERTIILEDTPELKTPNSTSLSLYTRTNPHATHTNLDLSDLIKESLRLRPDRIVVGEVRGKEAKDLILALSTGHKGSFGSLHANSAQEALLRLEMLVQLGAPDWSLETIRKMIFFGIQYIIKLKKNDKTRCIDSITKITGLEESGLLLENLKNNLN